MLSLCKLIPISITQEVLYKVEALAKKDGIKSPLKFKYCKEGLICEDDDENDDINDSITGVDNEDEEEYEPTI